MTDVHAIGIGDMDKDGNKDLVVAEQDQSPLRRVTVYYDDGKGNLRPEIISNAEGHNISLGDVVGNGALDILTLVMATTETPTPCRYSSIHTSVSLDVRARVEAAAFMK